jgi:hypothetical protein
VEAGLTEVLKESGTSRRKEGGEATWKDAWAGFQEQVPAAFGSRLNPLAGLTLDATDAFVGDVVKEALQPFIPKGYAGVRTARWSTPSWSRRVTLTSPQSISGRLSRAWTTC